MSWILAVDRWTQLDGDMRITYKKGDRLDSVNGEDLERLISIHAVEDTEAIPLVVEDKIEEEETEVKEPVENTGDAPTIVFPKNAEKLDVWKTFGESHGVDVKGKTKAEIKAAVKAKLD
nr:MAG TPA: hypothetical protein [Caudoviricetes sp.]